MVEGTEHCRRCTHIQRAQNRQGVLCAKCRSKAAEEPFAACDSEGLAPERVNFSASGAVGLRGIESRSLAAYVAAFGSKYTLFGTHPAAVVEVFSSRSPSCPARSLPATEADDRMLLLEAHACSIIATGAALSGECFNPDEHMRLALLANVKLQQLLKREKAIAATSLAGGAAHRLMLFGISKLLLSDAIYCLLTGRNAHAEECLRHARETMGCSRIPAEELELPIEVALHLVLLGHFEVLCGCRRRGYVPQGHEGHISRPDASNGAYAVLARSISGALAIAAPEAAGDSTSPTPSSSCHGFKGTARQQDSSDSKCGPVFGLWKSMLFVVDHYAGRFAAVAGGGGGAGGSDSSGSSDSDSSDSSGSDSDGRSGSSNRGRGSSAGGSSTATTTRDDAKVKSIGLGPTYPELAGADITGASSNVAGTTASDSFLPQLELESDESSLSEAALGQIAALCFWSHGRSLQLEGAGCFLGFYWVTVHCMARTFLPWSAEGAAQMAKLWMKGVKQVAERCPGLFVIFSNAHTAATAISGIVDKADYSLFVRAWAVVRRNTGGVAPLLLERKELLKIGMSGGAAERTVAMQMQVSWARWARKNEEGIAALSMQ